MNTSETTNNNRVKNESSASLPIGERQLLMKRIVIHHDRSREAAAMVKRAHYPVEGGVPDYGSLSALIGESRVGKSFAVGQYAKEHPPSRKSGGVISPVLTIDVPGGGQRGLLEAMAEALKLPYAQKFSIPSLVGNILRGLVDCKVELLLLDEVQTILSEDNRKMIPFMRTFLRKMLNLRTLNIVCIGLEETYALMAADSQLTGRGGLPYEVIRSYSWDGAEEQKLFRLLCGEFDKRLPFNQRTGLQSVWFAHRLYYSTDRGNIGRLKDFLFSAGCMAINDHSDKIEAEHFAAAYDRVKKPGVGFNPWRSDMSLAPPVETDAEKLKGAPRDVYTKSRKAH